MLFLCRVSFACAVLCCIVPCHCRMLMLFAACSCSLPHAGVREGGGSDPRVGEQHPHRPAVLPREPTVKGEGTRREGGREGGGEGEYESAGVSEGEKVRESERGFLRVIQGIVSFLRRIPPLLCLLLVLSSCRMGENSSSTHSDAHPVPSASLRSSLLSCSCRSQLFPGLGSASLPPSEECQCS